MNSVRMGAGRCVIARSRTSLNLRSGRMYHPRMEEEGKVEKRSNINADEY